MYLKSAFIQNASAASALCSARIENDRTVRMNNSLSAVQKHN